jgi:hypothetical protein
MSAKRELSGISGKSLVPNIKSVANRFDMSRH